MRFSILFNSSGTEMHMGVGEGDFYNFLVKFLQSPLFFFWQRGRCKIIWQRNQKFEGAAPIDNKLGSSRKKCTIAPPKRY